MDCAPILFFGGTEDVRFLFSCFAFADLFRWYRGRPVPFSSFPLPNMFSAVPRASGPVFMFSAPGLVFDGVEWSGPVFMFSALGIIFGDIEGVGSHFHVLCSRTHFRRCWVRRVPYSCFARSELFWVVPRASGLVFMFCAPGLIFGCTECVRSRFHVLRARTNFRRYRGRRVPFSFIVLPDSFSAVPCVSGSVFMFCTPGIIFGGTEGVGSHFHVLCSRTRFQRCRVRRVPF
jgi:hypothetical protein